MKMMIVVRIFSFQNASNPFMIFDIVSVQCIVDTQCLILQTDLTNSLNLIQNYPNMKNLASEAA